MPRMELIEGVHYYLEGELYVFTGIHLLKRGYCCGSKCRHCPYPKEVQVEAIGRRLAGRAFTKEDFEARYAGTVFGTSSELSL